MWKRACDRKMWKRARSVTGESLKTVNARRTVMRLADSLGDFVVASAGPHLESVIAGRGAGAAALSRRGAVRS